MRTSLMMRMLAPLEIVTFPLVAMKEEAGLHRGL
jgi:hypothetical protein